MDTVKTPKCGACGGSYTFTNRKKIVEPLPHGHSPSHRFVRAEKPVKAQPGFTTFPAKISPGNQS